VSWLKTPQIEIAEDRVELTWPTRRVYARGALWVALTVLPIPALVWAASRLSSWLPEQIGIALLFIPLAAAFVWVPRLVEDLKQPRRTLVRSGDTVTIDGSLQVKVRALEVRLAPSERRPAIIQLVMHQQVTGGSLMGVWSVKPPSRRDVESIADAIRGLLRTNPNSDVAIRWPVAKA
jgi:hypothetical protein